MGGDRGYKRKHDGGGGPKGGGGKRKYVPNKSSSACIPHDTQGFFLTCQGGWESRTARDVTQALKELWEKKTGSTSAEDKKEDKKETDVAAALAAELEELKEESAKPVFEKIESGGINGIIFLRQNKEHVGPSPPELGQALLQQIKDTNTKVCRAGMRMLPVETTCYAGLEDIKKHIAPLIEKHLPGGGEAGSTFSVMYEKRANDSLDRMQVINTVAEMVPAPHKVDLTNPQLTIVVQIVKSVCCLSVIGKYHDLCKYNLTIAAMTEEEREATYPSIPSGGVKGVPNEELVQQQKEGTADPPAAEGETDKKDE